MRKKYLDAAHWEAEEAVRTLDKERRKLEAQLECAKVVAGIRMTQLRLMREHDGGMDIATEALEAAEIAVAEACLQVKLLQIELED